MDANEGAAVPTRVSVIGYDSQVVTLMPLDVWVPDEDGGNVLGSNISNLLLVMGGPALFSAIPYDAAYNVDLALLAVFSLVLVGFAFVGRRHDMSRANGIVFVMLYAAYLALSVIR